MEVEDTARTGIAIAALNGILAGHYGSEHWEEMEEVSLGGHHGVFKRAAEKAVRHADALIYELEKH